MPAPVEVESRIIVQSPDRDRPDRIFTVRHTTDPQGADVLARELDAAEHAAARAGQHVRVIPGWLASPPPPNA